MTIFIDALGDVDKHNALAQACNKVRNEELADNVFSLRHDSLRDIPTAAFAYWTTGSLRQAFRNLSVFQSGRRHACKTNPAGDDTRYLRLWWEPKIFRSNTLAWVPISKGGRFNPYYSDVHLVVAWCPPRQTYLGFLGTSHRPLERPASLSYFFRPGITWPSRTEKFGPRVMPRGGIFTGKGPAAFDQDDDEEHLLATCAVMNSEPFRALIETRLNAADAAARSYEVGMIQQTPMPELDRASRAKLAGLALTQWRKRLLLDSVVETSHAFVGPESLVFRSFAQSRNAITAELSANSDAINSAAYAAYGLLEIDCRPRHEPISINEEDEPDEEEREDDADEPLAAGALGSSQLDSSLLSWCVGVAFGRFNGSFRFSDGIAELAMARPFDPTPEISPAMRKPSGAGGGSNREILVEDRGHVDDLSLSIEKIFETVSGASIDGIRDWLRRDFFPYHLRHYSKSRRKAPIYWPLTTTSGTFTLWIYYPGISSQTLFVAINDFVEPQCKQVSDDVAALRNKGSGRTRDDEKQFEALQGLEAELLELRDKLQEIAPGYKPNHDDGVQITAAPLWPLFRHKPWQKLLKDTWAKLERGDYDWARLAMAYWPERVREKCKTDKSLAIAHGLEDLYVEPAAAPKKTRGRKKAADTE